MRVHPDREQTPSNASNTTNLPLTCTLPPATHRLCRRSFLCELQSLPCQWTLRGLRPTEMIVRPQTTRAPNTGRPSTGRHRKTRKRTTRQRQKLRRFRLQSRSPSSAPSVRSKKGNTNALAVLFPSKICPTYLGPAQSANQPQAAQSPASGPTRRITQRSTLSPRRRPPNQPNRTPTTTADPINARPTPSTS